MIETLSDWLGLAQGWRTMISGGLILVAILVQHEGTLDWLRAIVRRPTE